MTFLSLGKMGFEIPFITRIAGESVEIFDLA